MKWLLAIAGLVAADAAAAQEQLRFVTCPIYRDTDAGRKSGCWLADDPVSGIRYDVTNAPTKPDYGHAVLVEGIVAPAGDTALCGGTVLDPVRTSILSERCTRHMLPAEGHPGRRFTLPPRNVAPVSVARSAPERPYANRTFSLVYDFGRNFIVYQLDDYILDQAISWIRAVNPRRILVTGHAATSPATVSGRTLRERPELARERAERITEALVRLGVTRDRITTRWRTGARPSPVDGADGLIEPSRRRVDIDILDPE